MSNNDKKAVGLILVALVVFVAGLYFQEPVSTVSGLIGILIGAGAVRGRK